MRKVFSSTLMSEQARAVDNELVPKGGDREALTTGATGFILLLLRYSSCMPLSSPSLAKLTLKGPAMVVALRFG